MPPRVLILTPTLLHSRGAINPRAIRSERLIAGLAALGFEVDVASWWGGDGRPPERPYGARRLWANGAGDPLGAIDDPPPRPGRSRDPLEPWAIELERRLAAESAAELPEVLLAIAYPLGAILAGARLNRRFGIPFVADLGDPWPARDAGEAESRLYSLRAADALITTTPGLATELGPLLRPGVGTLLAPAGGELRRRTGTRDPGAPPLFVHLGVINEGRVAPEPAFAELGRLHRAGRIEFRSHSGGFHPRLHALGHPHSQPLAHERSIDLLAEASAALVLGNRNRNQLPSKLFEIACTQAWALCISEIADDPAAAVLAAGGHGVLAANDPGSIAAAIELILDREERGERPEPDPGQSWDRRCEEIAELLESVSRA
jgi:hypothetical protein